MSTWMPNGLGQALGDKLATGVGLTVLDNHGIFYVGPTNASDADIGTDPLRPLATVGQAVTNAIDYELIALMDGLIANFTGNLVIDKNLVFTAGGQSSGQPTVKWGLAGGGISIQVIAADVEFRNITFTAPTASNAAPRIIVDADNCLFRNCRFEMNGNDAGTAVVRLDGAANTGTRFDGCTFVVTSTDVASRPPPAIYVNGSVDRVDLIDCTFDGGTTGFGGGGYAIDSIGGLTTVWRLQNTTMLRGPDLVFRTGARGFVQIPVNTGGSKVYVL